MSDDLGGRVADPVEQSEEEEGPSALEIMTSALFAMDIEFTTIMDEAGTTLEIQGGNRGTREFSGFAITYNYGPDESFLFMGAVAG